MLTDLIKTAFSERYGSECRLFAAPGRINIIGEHTDYNNGFVLPAAINKKIRVALNPTDDAKVSVYSVDMDESVTFDIHGEVKGLPQWAKYPFGVVREFMKAGFHPKGFNAVFAGDIPAGAGLSSSAALESAFAVALNTVYNLGANNFELALICQMAEHHYAGVKCGIMDQFASIFGKKDHAIRLDCRSLEFEYFPLNTGNYRLMLADTRVKHSLASSEYNVRRQECEKGVQVISSKLSGIKSLRDLNPVEIRSFKNDMEPVIYDRCEYVTEENERVLKTCEALAKGDLLQVGQWMFASHEGLSKKYGVSCPELDLLVDTATQLAGVSGARMMGGGFGGCTINLVDGAQMEKVKKELDCAFQEQFGRNLVFYEVNTDDGATEI